MDASERDAYLDQVLVGGRERRQIVIVDYDTAWPARFELERDRVRNFWRDGTPDVERHLRFRDRLRESAEDRCAYERLKRSLAERERKDMNDYADAKGELIEAILARVDA